MSDHNNKMFDEINALLPPDWDFGIYEQTAKYCYFIQTYHEKDDIWETEFSLPDEDDIVKQVLMIVKKYTHRQVRANRMSTV